MKLNDPVWVLGVCPGYFECYLDESDPEDGMRIGVSTNTNGFGAVVPSQWVSERNINGQS